MKSMIKLTHLQSKPNRLSLPSRKIHSTLSYALISSMLGVRIVDCHERYLGLPTIARSSKNQMLKHVRDMLWSRLNGRNAKLLSVAGKDVLIRAVAQALPTYTMGVFQLPPQSLCHDLSATVARFWRACLSISANRKKKKKTTELARFSKSLRLELPSVTRNPLNFEAMASTKVQRIMTQPINLIFRFLQSKARIQIWLFEQKDQRIEGRIIGFDEYMNLVLDEAEEVSIKKNTRKSLGRILLKGDNITLMMNTNFLSNQTKAKATQSKRKGQQIATSPLGH
ncbi:hypothetical protein GBA52_004793 [Prunus armeniaca]|nr:hypothetical protein GBA52_004793 [Prunus armeniaca]